SGWEPDRRVFDEELSAEPLKWLGERLADLDGVLRQSGVDPAEVGADDAASLRETAPEIVDTVRRLLDRVRAGELGTAPAGGPAASVRSSWL
ncbi:hypothetical protein ACWCSD_31450, partial [Nonomuraea sp. NPDC001684]